MHLFCKFAGYSLQAWSLLGLSGFLYLDLGIGCPWQSYAVSQFQINPASRIFRKSQFISQVLRDKLRQPQNEERMGIRTFMIAVAFGALGALLALSAFGYLVAFHPFGREAERSEWLVPLLHILSWLPPVALGSAALVWAGSPHACRVAFAASASAMFMVVAEALYYVPGLGLLEILSILWLHLLCPLVLLPASACLLAKRSVHATADGGA